MSHATLFYLLARFADRLGFQFAGEGSLVCLRWDKRCFEDREIFAHVLVTTDSSIAMRLLGFDLTEYQSLLNTPAPTAVECFRFIASSRFYSPMLFPDATSEDAVLNGFLGWQNLQMRPANSRGQRELVLDCLGNALATVPEFNGRYRQSVTEWLSGIKGAI
jgi:hypothetical protein